MMESFRAWLLQVTENAVLYDILSRYSWVDGFTFFFFLVGMAQGIKKGLMRKLAQILELSVMIMVVYRLYRPVDFILRNIFSYIPSETGLIISYILLMLLMWGLINIADYFLVRAFHTVIYPPVRVMGGAIAGGIHGLVVWSLIAFALAMFPFQIVRGPFEIGNSYSGHYVVKMAPHIYKSVGQSVGIVDRNMALF